MAEASATILNFEEQKLYEKKSLEFIKELRKQLHDKTLWKTNKTGSKKKYGLQLFNREYEDKFRMYKAETVLKGITPKQYFDVEIGETRKEGFDMKTRNKRITYHKRLEIYNENYYLMHQCGKGTKLVKNREFLCIGFSLIEEKEIFHICYSVDEKDDPKVPLIDEKKNKRGKLVTGTHIMKQDSGIKICQFNFINARGKIKPKILNAGLVFGLSKNMKRGILKFNPDLKKKRKKKKKKKKKKEENGDEIEDDSSSSDEE